MIHILRAEYYDVAREIESKVSTQMSAKYPPYTIMKEGQ